jgi:hypothetical protein
MEVEANQLAYLRRNEADENSSGDTSIPTARCHLPVEHDEEFQNNSEDDSDESSVELLEYFRRAAYSKNIPDILLEQRIQQWLTNTETVDFSCTNE